MKRLAPLVFLAVIVTTANARAQHQKSRRVVTLDEVIDSAFEAFTSSYDAWLTARDEAERLRSFQRKYYAQYAVAADYWNASAEFQYAACQNAYKAWTALLHWRNGLRRYGSPGRAFAYWDNGLWKFADASEANSYLAWLFASIAESKVGWDYYPALSQASNAYEFAAALKRDLHAYDPTALSAPVVVDLP